MNKLKIKKNPENKKYYLDGEINYRGIPIKIENWKGSLRKGKDKNGKEWQTIMQHHYGFVNKVVSNADKDFLDCFVNSEPIDSDLVFIVHQKDDKGNFDEHKVLLVFLICRKLKKVT